MTDINFDAYDGFQVLGQNLQNMKDGFGQFSLLASALLLEEGLGDADENGLAKYEPTKWYPLKSHLRAFHRIRQEYGGLILKQVGEFVPKGAVFPPTVTDITSALAAIDVAYHLNHGTDHKPLLKMESGQILDWKEGIGHYKITPVAGQKKIVCVCDNPYPCDFDQGLILAMAQRFQPSATLVHDNPSVCRTKGAKSCSYTVTWK